MNENHIGILEMMINSDWEYKNHVISDLMSNFVGIGLCDVDGVPSRQIYKVLHSGKTKVGFYILRKFAGNWKKVEIMYLFIKPEHRKKGYASRIIKSIQLKSNNIYLDTKDDKFIKLISKLDFKRLGLCKNGVESCYHYGSQIDKNCQVNIHQ